jgi:hypothetical protein
MGAGYFEVFPISFESVSEVDFPFGSPGFPCTITPADETRDAGP